MIVLDTTVLVYAKGAAHPLRDPCRRLLAAIIEREVQATTTVEAIQEFVHVRARRRDSAGARALVSANSAFATVPTLAHVFPDKSGLAGIIA
jgi:predicted nucleic acid-binding protein